MFKNLAAIPSIVGYRRIILLGRMRSHDVVQYKLKTSHDVPQGCAIIVRRRVMVVRWSCLKLYIYSWWSHRPLRRPTIIYDG